MKRITICFMAMLVLIFTFQGNAATKYDWVKTDPGWNWRKAVNIWEKINDRLIIDYLDLIINEEKLVKISNSSQKFNNEQKKFVIENKKDITKMCQITLAQGIFKGGKPTDNEFRMVTAIIKDPKTVQAKNAVEYEMEKTALRGMFLYTYWEATKDPKIYEDFLINLFKRAGG